MTRYNSWPLGGLPPEWRRPEPELIKTIGYDWSDPRDIIDIFEKKLANYAGSKFAVSVDCDSNALFLALKYRNGNGEVSIPRHTYVSVPMQIHHAGYVPVLRDEKWIGLYELKPLDIYDSAVRFTKGMYVGGNALQVLSFQIKKRMPIGRGGAILTDDEDAYRWLKLATYDGRDLTSAYTDSNHVQSLGWHYYMTPEDAARGIWLMDQLPEENGDTGSFENYPDLTQWPIIKDLVGEV
jgi:dTDP-4-amino-4,6-dideoxygalactose transaminase